ncbi:hypothetical protein TBLA_0A08090 [Henningerozyma blattae CBS 6284]|uniref:Uncharacterized protein n=1 Tax=Henningerozyma blattae (strain ATCC 34711 / CBS 6284 / DSM 70876 / NBRC 10599 / NRRL Y-10934 / UCD 77-7) TaxID=1071380 RepID=I2GWU7_HENB6|nr:hypothetical protein TBLA_0A08090 [Tetrapisispora blattae CBS 6284]CCH58599.1 hypothetical protein TBLA_0A08090 [Tetrapisispora blattae CBS 6284]
MVLQYSSNVILLLLQLILYHQESLSHRNKKLRLPNLLVDPIIDEAILNEFKNHTLVKVYAPELCKIQLRSLRMLVKEIFSVGFNIEENEDNINGNVKQENVSYSDSNQKQDTIINVITLANFYYDKRITEIEKRLPEIRDEMQETLS